MMDSVIKKERAAIKELDSIVQTVRVWIFAPPLGEAQRRAELLRRLIGENPE